MNVDWLIVAEPPIPRVLRAGCHVIGRKSTLHFWAMERNAIRSFSSTSLVRVEEAEEWVNIPYEYVTDEELRRENIVYVLAIGQQIYNR